MALATQCPHCHTTFRVAQDQLKLRAGLVRCGNCKQIFNGVEHLLPPETPSSQPSAKTAPPVEAEIGNESTASAVPEALPSPAPSAEAPAASPMEDPLQRMTLIDISPRSDAVPAMEEAPAASSSPAPQNVPDPLAEAIDKLRKQPLRGSKPRKTEDADPEDQIDTDEEAEPAFVVQGRRRQRFGRIARVIMGIGIFVLACALLFQAAYVFHDQIAARFPATKSVLAQVCNVFGCQVGLPAQIEAVSLESSELQALAPEKNTFVFNALLRNRDATAQAWPHIELTLNDLNEQAVARRVFAPRDYLGGAQDTSTGLAGNSERAVKLYFSLSQLKAAGYRVYLFYP